MYKVLILCNKGQLRIFFTFEQAPARSKIVIYHTTNLAKGTFGIC